MSNKTDLAVYRPKLPQPRALSGREVLDALVTVAYEADQRFNPEMLETLWDYGNSDYINFIHEIAEEFGLLEPDLPKVHQVITGVRAQHTHIKRRNIDHLLNYMKVVDSEKLSSMKEDDGFLLVANSIGYSLFSSSRYYNAEDASFFTHIKNKVLGNKDISKVEEEIVRLLEPRQLNDSANPYDIIFPLSDLFSYGNRLFMLQQSTKGPLQHKGYGVKILWSLGIYTSWPDPLGYIILNDQQITKQSLLPNK